MARNASSFNRSKPKYKPQPTVLVICEDKKSGKRYLEDASVHFRIKVQVEIIHCGNTDPKGIVAAAIERQGKFDKVFCMIDRDTHKNFAEAVELVKTSKKVELIASYPCFEFWLLLHFGYNRKPYTAKLLLTDLQKYPSLENYDKGSETNIFNTLLNKFPQARQLSPRILEEAKTSCEMNPSTQLHELMDEFEKLSQPQSIESKQ